MPGHGGALPGPVLELLLQACGVWELAASGRMMRPSWIDEVLVAGQSPGSARVEVHPDGAGGFDGIARDATGRVLLQVSGYRPVPLGDATWPDARRRLTERIDHQSTTSEGTSEGARR